MAKKFLSGKIALVTGSAKNLGAQIAISLAKAGAIVIMHYNTSRKDAQKTFMIVKKSSPKSILLQADLMDTSETEGIFGAIEKKFGRLDILVNTVGDFIWKDILDTTPEDLKYIIGNNLRTAFTCMKLAVPLMRKNKYGRIINFGCVGCDKITVRKMTSPYYVAKTGLYIMSKSLSAETAKYGITINMISPGVIKTSVSKPDRITMPMKRFAQFHDIINAVIFLLSDKSDYISGANIEVAGAWLPGMTDA